MIKLKIIVNIAADNAFTYSWSITMNAPSIPQTPYTSCYCEENIYLLAQAFLDDLVIAREWEVFVVFISNQSKTVAYSSPSKALWNQKCAQDPGAAVVWDYHVVLLLQLRNKTAGSIEPAEVYAPYGGEHTTSWIYDLDTGLPLPCPLRANAHSDYMFKTFMDVPPRYQSLHLIDRIWYVSKAGKMFYKAHGFQLVKRGVAGHDQEDQDEYIAATAYISAPPTYKAIRGIGAVEKGVLNNLMSSFVDMVSSEQTFGLANGHVAHVNGNGTSSHTHSESENGSESQEVNLPTLGYLYSAISLQLIRPHNARAVLAAGCLLGGMDDLCNYAYGACKQSISVDTIGNWVEFIDSIPSSSSDGTSTPDRPKTTIFGLYAQRLRDEVFHFLVDTLPEFLEVQRATSDQPSTSGPSGRDLLLQIYSRVPFEMFKTAVESPSFRVDSTGSDQARFKFAKDAIELRKRGIARGSGAEETVVLAFGGGNGAGSSVHITRKMRKRPLWKVNA
ncbi:hypothetical protein H0H93_007232 [Arthromyces matolae]|nr:hypothetical protein H0H93_007232 [Arthromyces matolae]